jgi:hypothetical protein
MPFNSLPGIGKSLGTVEPVQILSQFEALVLKPCRLCLEKKKHAEVFA